MLLLDFRQGYLFLFVGCLSLSHDVYPFCRMFIPLLLISLLLMAYCLNNAFWNAYLLESLLRVYIQAVLAGPIVMIVAHRW